MNEQSTPPRIVLFAALGLCMVFILFGSIFGAYLYKQMSYAKESKNWPSIDGMIISAERFSVTPGSAGTQAGVEYTYSVEGKKYNGHRLHFGMSITGMDERVWRDLPSQGNITIHYHPEKHDLSTIGVEFNPKDQWLLAFPGAFIAFGGFIIACMIPAFLKQKAQPVVSRQ